MDWGSTPWVKLYTKNTANWVSLSWEARSVLMHLFRVCDRNGVIEGGANIDALATLIFAPRNTASHGVTALVTQNICAVDGENLVILNFRDAQMARTTNAERARRFRENRKTSSNYKVGVTQSNSASHGVTQSNDKNRIEENRIDKNRIEKKEDAGDKKPSPLALLTDALCVEFQKARGIKYQHGGAKDMKALKAILSNGEEEILRRWRIGLDGVGWKQVNTIAQLASKWNDIGAPDLRAVKSPHRAESTDWSKLKTGDVHDF